MQIKPETLTLSVADQLTLQVNHAKNSELPTDAIKALLLATCYEVMVNDNKIRFLLKGGKLDGCNQNQNQQTEDYV